MGIVYQETILVSGMMCLDGCGVIVENQLREAVEKKNLPNLRVYVFAEPLNSGIQKIVVTIYDDDNNPSLDQKAKQELSKSFRVAIEEASFSICEDSAAKRDKSAINWINILINVIAIVSIIVFSIIFPPSLLLSLGLGAICFLVTLFTARDYIFNFIKSLSNFEIQGMQTTVSLGWLLAMAHGAYHIGIMPVMRSFAMTFMNFVMPLALITIVNVMDELKRQISLRSQKLLLNGLQSIFPQMRDEYMAVVLTNGQSVSLQEMLQDPEGKSNEIASWQEEQHTLIELTTTERNMLLPGMLIKVEAGACFPVDGVIVSGDSVIDRSIITGEQQPILTNFGMRIEAGSTNLLNDVMVLAETSTYRSTVNKILFKANTKDENESKEVIDRNKPQQKFYYYYFGFFALGFVVTLVLSIALGFFTITGMLQTMIGILFAICPCTIAIGHYLPKLLQAYQVSSEGILVKNVAASCAAEDFDVFVFDKTGTLTESSVVDSVAGISEDLFAKIYRAEAMFGREHPIAKALKDHFSKYKDLSLMEQCELEERTASGITVKFSEDSLCIGNAQYLRSQEINVPEGDTPDSTYVYVGFNKEYQGKILIKHQLRQGMQDSLQKLKNIPGNTLIMLTGDNEGAAVSLNSDLNKVFSEIYAQQTPEQKANTLENIVKKYAGKKICFIGDGLNDAICAKKLRDLGGTSISITANDKSAFFTDFSLNGCLDYFFAAKDLSSFTEKIVEQNRWILACGAFVFLTFLISFPVLGIGMSPLIPMLVMFATTIFALVNSYRTSIAAANDLGKKEPSLLSKIMCSELGIGLLVGGSLLLVTAVLVASIASLQLALPLFVFTGGAATIVSSSFLVAATVMLASSVTLACAYAMQSRFESCSKIDKNTAETSEKIDCFASMQKTF